MKDFKYKYGNGSGYRPTTGLPGDANEVVLNDFRKMTLIAFSCISLAFAGLFSRASQAETLADVEAVQPAAPSTVQVTGRPISRTADRSPEVQFAESQFRRYSALRQALHERARNEANADQLPKMRKSLAALEQRLNESREAIEMYSESRQKPEKKQDEFLREGMKGSLLALQDAGQQAISAFVDADNRTPADNDLIARYEMRDNRTGQ